MGFFFPYLLAGASGIGIWFGGIWAWTGILMIFGVNVLLDESIRDREIPSGFWQRLILHHGAAEAALLFSFPFLVLFLGFTLWRIQSFELWWELVGALLSIGIMMGLIAINAAHELVHRRSQWARAVGVLNLSLVNFCWYRISHIDIHHRFVATEKDPASAHADEKVWSYWFRSFFGNLREVFRFEVAKHGFGFRNRLWHYVGLFLGLGFLMLFAGGVSMLWHWLLVSLIAILMLETVDYIEHKGLVRAIGPEGRPEPVRAWHNWDSYHLITNLALFNLGFHANHHLKAAVEFPALGRTEGAKRMPYGYAVMILRALVGMR